MRSKIFFGGERWCSWLSSVVLVVLVLVVFPASFSLVGLLLLPFAVLVLWCVLFSLGLLPVGLALCILVAFVSCWLVFLVVSLLVLFFPSVGSVAFLLSVAPVLVLFFSSSLALVLALSVCFLPLPLPLLWRACDVPPLPLSLYDLYHKKILDKRTDGEYNISMQKTFKEVKAMQKVRLRKKQLAELLKSFGSAKDKKGRSLLERARQYLMEHPKADKYTTTITYTMEEGKLYVEWNCSCRDADRHNNDGLACKHVVALLILEHRDILETHKDWANWFKEYDQAFQRAVEEELKKVLEEFGNF